MMPRWMMAIDIGSKTERQSLLQKEFKKCYVVLSVSLEGKKTKQGLLQLVKSKSISTFPQISP